MTTGTTANSNRRQDTLREDTTTMFHVDVRLAEIQERHRRDRVLHDRERDALRSAHSYRHRFGQLLVRLGRRIGGEATTAPAWQG